MLGLWVAYLGQDYQKEKLIKIEAINCNLNWGWEYASFCCISAPSLLVTNVMGPIYKYVANHL